MITKKQCSDHRENSDCSTCPGCYNLDCPFNAEQEQKSIQRAYEKGDFAPVDDRELNIGDYA